MPPIDRPDGLVRPFLNRGPKARQVEDDVAAATPPSSTGVRSYMITKGRTHTDGVRLEFETILSVTALGERRGPSMNFEQGKVMALCLESQQSVAEVAALLNLPIGVAKVVCADLVGEGLLEPHAASSDVASDVSLLTRLIQGVRAL
jgi:hypothetical protein